jgi:hypothetical protein
VKNRTSQRSGRSLGWIAAAAILCVGGPALAHPTGYPHRHVRAGYGYDPQQDEWVTRVYLGFGVEGAGVINQSASRGIIASGGGAGIWLGFRVLRALALEFGYHSTYHNPIDQFDAYWGYVGTSYLVWSEVTADLKLHLPTHSNLDPYLMGGGGWNFIGRGYGSDFSGPGFHAGGGLDVWLSHFVTLGVRGYYRGAYFSVPLRTADSDYISSLVFQANLGLHF